MSSIKFPTITKGLPWTGERFVVGLAGQIEFEHYHRYLFATQFCRDRTVLDIASGEGYGSHVLSQFAQRVYGVDIDKDSVEHAKAQYGSDTVTFLEGSCLSIPLPDASVDVVVSFETIEHFSGHDVFLGEVRRVLRNDGILVISSPDRDVYTNPDEPNPYHQLELSHPEFAQVLARHFERVEIGFQKATTGSVILPNGADQIATEVFRRIDGSTFEDSSTLQRAPYLVAVATNAGMPLIRWGVLDDARYLNLLYEQCAAAERLRQEAVAATVSLEQRVAAVTNELRGLETQYDAQVTRYGDLKQQYQGLESQKNDLASRLAVIESSSSWRVALRIQTLVRALRLQGIARRLVTMVRRVRK